MRWLRDLLNSKLYLYSLFQIKIMLLNNYMILNFELAFFRRGGKGCRCSKQKELVIVWNTHVKYKLLYFCHWQRQLSNRLCHNIWHSRRWCTTSKKMKIIISQLYNVYYIYTICYYIIDFIQKLITWIIETNIIW